MVLVGLLQQDHAPIGAEQIELTMSRHSVDGQILLERQEGALGEAGACGATYFLVRELRAGGALELC